MNEFLTLMFVDILLGFVPQAIGCAIFMFTIANKKIRSRAFLCTAAIYSAIAMVIRILYNSGLIDFGFHTIIIWILFIVVAILYNKVPAFQATVSILVSGILITISEIIVVCVMLFSIGEERFNEIMNNATTIDAQITKAVWGVPANFLFLIIVVIVGIVVKSRRKKDVKTKD